VRTYFDTSVLIGALVQAERHHAACLHEFISVSNPITSTHAVAEVFATMTSGRLPVQFAPADAEHSIRSNILSRFEIITLSIDQYSEAMTASGRVGARGGAFFDVLHIQAARLGKAEKLLTLNDRHFLLFAEDLKSLIGHP
jgi:predicted nucleic acid-binding protein